MDTFAHQLVEERGWLARAARSQLRNVAWAEDAVSETVLAALEKRPAFSDPQRLRAWLFGVLRHKVVDQLRSHLDSPQGVTRAAEQALDDAAGNPAEEPPQRAVQAQFVAALALALAGLPPAQSRAFEMREAWGHDTADICAELAVSPNHLWVMLHRARASLRLQLGAHGP